MLRRKVDLPHTGKKTMQKRKLIKICANIHCNGAEGYGKFNADVSFFIFARCKTTVLLGTFYKSFYRIDGPLEFLPIVNNKNYIKRNMFSMGNSHDKPDRYTPFDEANARPLAKEWRWKLLRARKRDIVASLFTNIGNTEYGSSAIGFLRLVAAVTISLYIFKYVV